MHKDIIDIEYITRDIIVAAHARARALREKHRRNTRATTRQQNTRRCSQTCAPMMTRGARAARAARRHAATRANTLRVVTGTREERHDYRAQNMSMRLRNIAHGKHDAQHRATRGRGRWRSV